jgi:tyrosyl-tRNA synthetase
LSEIEAVMRSHATAPEQRTAQRELAAEMTRRIHGEAALQKAEVAAGALFGGGRDGENGERTAALLEADMPEVVIPAAEFGEGLALADVLVRAGLASSKADARRGIEGRGYYLSDETLTDPGARLLRSDLLNADGKLVAILRKGKKNYVRLVVIDD